MRKKKQKKPFFSCFFGGGFLQGRGSRTANNKAGSDTWKTALTSSHQQAFPGTGMTAAQWWSLLACQPFSSASAGFWPVAHQIGFCLEDTKVWAMCGGNGNMDLFSLDFYVLPRFWAMSANTVVYLSRVYCRAAWKQNSAAPRAPQAIPYRALFRQPKGPCIQRQTTKNLSY